MIEATGKIIGNYQIEALLGSGRSGQVYRARHRYLRQLVAVKLLHPALSHPSAPVEGLRAEARTLAGISHPHIVRVFDVGEHQGCGYLAMEYCNSGSLRDHIRANGTTGWPLALTLGLAYQVADALGYLHAREIIHRDITPANLLLHGLEAGDGVGPTRLLLKLADFGVGARVGDPASGMVAGTPAYMAPEQRLGAAPDPRADIYALAAVLYELITGHVAYGAGGLREAQQAPAAPLSPRAWRPDLPIQVEELIMRCLAHDPNERFHDVAALQDALRHATAICLAERAMEPL